MNQTAPTRPTAYIYLCTLGNKLPYNPLAFAHAQRVNIL